MGKFSGICITADATPRLAFWQFMSAVISGFDFSSSAQMLKPPQVASCYSDNCHVKYCEMATVLVPTASLQMLQRISLCAGEYLAGIVGFDGYSSGQMLKPQ